MIYEVQEKLLIEELAKRLHNAWWEESKRQQRKYSSMIPYEELSEEQKNLDRACAHAAIVFFAQMKSKGVLSLITNKPTPLLPKGRHSLP